MLKFVCLSTGISLLMKPMYETCKIALVPDTVKEKFPSKSVCVPLLVPFSIIVAPAKGIPLSSFSVPFSCIP